jgi:hypothetical protein
MSLDTDTDDLLLFLQESKEGVLWNECLEQDDCDTEEILFAKNAFPVVKYFGRLTRKGNLLIRWDNVQC